MALLDRRCTYVTASTGIAAIPLGGTTVHSFAGIGLGEEDKAMLLDRVRGNERSRNNWRQCRYLIIDEFSMVSGDLFDKLEFIAREIRAGAGQCAEPFGGIQLILCGDFLQLAPIAKRGQEPPYPFLCRAWQLCNPKVCILKEVFRQANQAFVQILNEVRMGEMSRDTVAMLTAQSSCTSVTFLAAGPAGSDGAAHADVLTDAHGRPLSQRFAGRTVLRSRNDDVDSINKRQFGLLDSPIYTFHDHATGLPHHVVKLRSESPVPEKLELRPGCRVMLCKNVDVSLGLVNGSVGSVVRFVEAALVDSFENVKAVEWTRCLRPAPALALPVVRFPVRRFHRGRKQEELVELDVIVEPQEWRTEQAGKALAARIQLPLRLAWAITVHKSQGMTLRSVNIDFNGMFAAGQAYVALSRCTTLEGMHLENFTAMSVLTSPECVAYYRALEGLAGVEDEDDAAQLICNPWGNCDTWSATQGFDGADPLSCSSVEAPATSSLDDDTARLPTAVVPHDCMLSKTRLVSQLQRRIAAAVDRPTCADVAHERDVRSLAEHRLVLDTCSLLHAVRSEDPTVIERIFHANACYIPQVVLLELDSQTKHNGMPELQFAARRARDLIDGFFREGRLLFEQPGERRADVLALQLPDGGRRDNDGQILAYAAYMKCETMFAQAEKRRPLVVCTEDRMLGLRCKSIGIPVSCFKPH